MMQIARLRLAVLQLAWMLCGCYSTSLLQAPEPMPPGGVRVAAGVSTYSERPWPAPEIGLRIGVVEDFELRGKLTAGLDGEIGINAQIYERDVLRLSLMPHYRDYVIEEDDDDYFDEYFVDDRHVRAIGVPVIASLRLTSDVDLFAGPAAHVGFRDGKSFIAGGRHAGVAFRPSRYVEPMLECSLLGTLAGREETPAVIEGHRVVGQSILTKGDIIGQCGISVSIGSSYGNAAQN